MEWGGENAIAGKSLPLAAVPTLFLFLSFLPLFGRANCRLRAAKPLFSSLDTKRATFAVATERRKSAVLWASSTADDNSASFFYARARPTTDHHHRGGIEEGLHARGRLSPGACAVRQRTQVGRSPKWLLTYSSASGGPPLLRTEKEERGREITLMLNPRKPGHFLLSFSCYFSTRCGGGSRIRVGKKTTKIPAEILLRLFGGRIPREKGRGGKRKMEGGGRGMMNAQCTSVFRFLYFFHHSPYLSFRDNFSFPFLSPPPATSYPEQKK